METFAITIYVISDEVLTILGNQDDPQSAMSNAEVITFAILAARYFSSNHKTTRYLCKKLRLFPRILRPRMLPLYFRLNFSFSP